MRETDYGFEPDENWDDDDDVVVDDDDLWDECAYEDRDI